MTSSRQNDQTFVCPNCGEDVPVGALRCPECGADEETGWASDAEEKSLDLPSHDDADPAGKKSNSTAAALWAALAIIAAVLMVIGKLLRAF